MRLVAAVALCLAADTFNAATAQPAAADPLAALPRAIAAQEALATLPPGTFLENLWVAPDGSLLITSYLAREVLRWRPGAGISVFARLPVHPVSLAADTDGTLYVAAHGKSFRQGAALLESQQIWRLGTGGAAELVMDVPEARFLNGIAWLGNGRFLVADSQAGVLWLFDARSKTMTPWLRHEDLQSALPQRMVPGANGINIVGSEVWVSNSSKRLLMSVPLLPDGTAGELRRRVQGLPIDDFAVASDGSVFAATHGTAVLRLRPDGPHAVVAESFEVQDSTSLRFGRGEADREQLYVVTSGGAFAGRTESAYLTRLNVGIGAAPLREPKKVQSNADQRLVLALRANAEAVQRALPAPWRLEPVAAGPARGATLSLIFIERLVAQDAQGRPDPAGVERSLVVTVPARHPLTGEAATFPIVAYTTALSQVPGPYSNSQAATITRRAGSVAADSAPAEIAETWQLRGASGGELLLELRGRASMPARTTLSASLRSPVQAGFGRTYLIEQGVVALRSSGNPPTDTVQSLALRSSLADLAALLDGSEPIVGVSWVPWYLRQVFVP
jgi:sugar lactone lactonase YvrE